MRKNLGKKRKEEWYIICRRETETFGLRSLFLFLNGYSLQAQPCLERKKEGKSEEGGRSCEMQMPKPDTHAELQDALLQ